MIDRQALSTQLAAAILAAVCIPAEHSVAREYNPGFPVPQIAPESHHGGELDRYRGSANELVVGFEYIHAVGEVEDDRPTPANGPDGAIGRVEQ